MKCETIPNAQVHVIACGVLAPDLKSLCQRLGLIANFHFLPGGLHTDPAKLRSRLQETIDALDGATDSASRIVIGYGVCGRGTVGLQARRLPLVIPRVHDCIALFLGSDAEYRKQFAMHPGTFYLSAGWLEEKENDLARPLMGSDATGRALSASAEDLSDAYGPEHGRYIHEFMHSWTRNYSRAAFIDTGIGKHRERDAQKARDMASEYGWQYERLQGSHHVLIEMLSTTRTNDHLLVVPPGATTVFDAAQRCLDCTQPGSTSAPSPAKLSCPGEGIETSSDAHQSSYLRQEGIGLGLDAGGTYTDAVLYDFKRGEVRSKAKALTTHWDFSIGIREALGKLDACLLRDVRLTAVSTTVATNALVEGHGQSVGLLVMPPCGWSEPDGFRHRPLEVIRGQLEIDGTETEPVDPVQIRDVAQKLIQKEGVSAFAVGGYAAHANPAHELQVKAILQESTGLSVTCSHALSRSLHYRIRAETAALNARIIPCLESLFNRISEALRDTGVLSPIMVVRSDGSFMKLSSALKRPLETMLSGPAASAAGAGWLAQTPNALVVDIGGTTTDTAILKHGRVRIDSEGARIGGWQTHIRALDLQTTGLGGDSSLQEGSDRHITIGPERIAPLCWLASRQPRTLEALAWLEFLPSSVSLSNTDMMLLARTDKPRKKVYSENEVRILDLITERPRSLLELADALDKPHPSLVRYTALMKDQLIERSGLTPTDILHATGRLCLWNHEAANKALRLMARHRQQAPDAWAQRVLSEFERTLASAILTKQLAEDGELGDLDQQPLARAMLNRILDRQKHAGFGINVHFVHPIIGIGAPSEHFIPGACQRLDADFMIPPHADVANAVGAIIGAIVIRREIRIIPNEQGGMRLEGVAQRPVYKNLTDANEAAKIELRTILTKEALQAGCAAPHLTFQEEDSIAPASDGTDVFICRTIKGEAIGPPDENL